MRELTLKQHRKIKAMRKTASALLSELDVYDTLFGVVNFKRVTALINQLNKHYGDFTNRKKKGRVNWHPYPDEKPKRKGYFLITTRYLYKVSVTRDLWDPYAHWLDHYDNRVLAWAEPPEPYRGR